MQAYFLSTSTRTPNAEVWNTINPKATKTWVKRLPTANFVQLTELLHARLKQLNQIEADPESLFECIELIRPFIYQILNHHHATPVGVKLPLNDEDNELSSNLLSILVELSKNYYSIALLLATDLPKSFKKLGPINVQRCMTSLGQIVLLHYLHKQPEPDGIWLDIHRLFVRFRQEAEKAVTDKVARELPKTSIADCYKQLLLLRLAQPFGLLKAETIELYFLLEKWSDLVELNLLDSNPNETSATCLINFNQDAPAAWQPYLGHINLNNILRLLDDYEEFVDDAMGRFETTTEKTSHQSISHGLIQHIKQSWEGHNRYQASLFEPHSTRICTLGITNVYKSLASTAEAKPVADYELLADTLEENTLQVALQQTEVLSLGQLIGFRPISRNRQQLTLALTTDIRHKENTLQIKLSPLTNKPYPATAQPLDCGDRPSNAVPVIIYFTQDNEGGKQTWVIVESKSIHADDRVQLVISDRKVIANVIAKKHIGTWCYLLQCEISKAF